MTDTLRLAFRLYSVTREIEGGEAFVIGGTLEHLRVAQGTNGVVIAGGQCSTVLAGENS
jgi:hypothetical protein